jgi:hypothetical protein
MVPVLVRVHRTLWLVPVLVRAVQPCPVSREACTVALRRLTCRLWSGRGYLVGAYLHPTTGTFHLLNCSGDQKLGVVVDNHKQPCFSSSFFYPMLDGAAAWCEVPTSTDTSMVALQSVGGIRHWLPLHKVWKELLVFDTVKVRRRNSGPCPSRGSWRTTTEYVCSIDW